MRGERNRWLERWWIACIGAVIMTASALAAPADQLEEAVSLYNEGKYQQSQERLLDVDRDALSDEQKKQRDELVEAVRTAINQSSKAAQNLADGDTAYAEGDRKKAEHAYRAVLNNTFATSTQKKRAQEGLGLLAKQQSLQKQLNAKSPATQPTASTDGRQSARNERDRLLADEKVRTGDVALNQGQYDLAAQAFEDALKLVPNHPKAMKGLDLVQRHRGVEGRGDLLTETIKRRQSRWMRTETLYAENERAIRQLIEQHEYVQARQKLEVARRLVNAARRDAEPAERYAFLCRQIDSLSRFIDDREDTYRQNQAAEQRQTAMLREQERSDAVRQEKDTRIARLMDEVMQLQKERSYGEAADVLREIIAIDPNYQYAEFLLRMVEDSELIRGQKINRRAFMDRFQEGVLGGGGCTDACDSRS